MMRVTLMGIALAFSSPRSALAGYWIDDYNIRQAVAAWLSNPAAAETTYGHISTWETEGVTDMSYLFCSYGYLHVSCNTAAASFNEDIGAWDTSGVTTMRFMFHVASSFNQDISAWNVDNVRDMHWMFHSASSFNQDIGGWSVAQVTNMNNMFSWASAFDQDLGWCVGNDVGLVYAFSNTQCASTWCGVNWASAARCGGSGRGTIDDSTIKPAVGGWMSNRVVAEAAYGHISTWKTGRVRNMKFLFYASGFNDDISAWDTSGVTSMSYMFWYNSAFNQNLGNWRVDKVTEMVAMFYSARSFDQDLGWCVGDDVRFKEVFEDTKCESTLCGVAQKDVIGLCEPWETMCLIGRKGGGGRRLCYITSGTLIIAIVLVLLAFGACVCCRKKKDETYAAAAWHSLCDCLICCCLRCMKKTAAPQSPPPLTPTSAFLKSLETRSPAKPETRAAAKAKFAPPFQRPGFTRKLSSFLFGEQEEETEQPPPLPTRRTEPEPSAPKFEEMYNQIAAWYKQPESAALRARWGAYPDPEQFQTWPGFVRVTNAFLDARIIEP